MKKELQEKGNWLAKWTIEKFANNEKIVVMLGDNIINESIKNAVNDFDKQENKEVLSILEELFKMKNLSKQEIIEIEDTIKIIRDPEKYEEETEKEIEKLKEYFNEYSYPK